MKKPRPSSIKNKNNNKLSLKKHTIKKLVLGLKKVNSNRWKNSSIKSKHKL